MAFNDRVAEIKSALQGLILSLDVADNRVEKFTQELGSGVQGASSFKDLADAVNRFASSMKQLDASKFTELNNITKTLQSSLNALSATGPNKVTEAYQQQARVLREIAQLQGTLRNTGTGSFSPAQQIFQTRQSIALDLIQQRHPNADIDRAKRLAADLAEGIQDDRYRLGNSIRVRTPQLAQELDVLAAQKNVVSPKGLSFDASLASFREQAKAEESASLIAQQAKLEDATRRRAAEIDSLNNIDADYAAAQKRHTDVIEAAARAEKEAQEAALKEAAARRQAIEEARALRVAPYQEQYGRLSQTAQRLLGANSPDFLSGKGDLLKDQDIARLERQAELFDKFNKEVRIRSGGQKELRPEGFTTQSYLDLNSGITKVVGQAQELDGSFINLNGRIDQNGRLTADLGTRYNSLFQTIGKNIVKVAEFAVATELVYGSIRKLSEAFQSVVSVQDELTQISFTIKEMGANADDFTKRFLQSGIQAGIKTGQGFEESIQTQLSAFRLTAGVTDLGERERITQQLSELELGTQTAFNLSKDQSIDSVGVIFRQIVDQGNSAGEAVDNLSTLLDKFAVAAQNSGVKGSELVQTFAQLVGASHDLNISQDELVALTSAFSQATNKSPQETANAIKILGERIYGEGSNDLNDLGIATREIDPSTGRARFRRLVDILRDSYIKSLESESSALQVSQAIGGQRRAPEAGSLVRSFPVYQDLEQVIAPIGQPGGPTGQFQDLVEELNKNLIPTLNTLSLRFSEVVSKILLDGGLLKDIVTLVKTITSVLEGLSSIDDPRIFKVIKEGITAIVLGLGYLGVSQINAVRRLSATFISLGESIRVAAQAQREFQAVQLNDRGGVGTIPYGPAPAPVAGGVEAKPFVKPETLARLRNALVGVGAVAVPVAFDLATSDQPNLEKYTGVGARIAGGLVGFMVGGPGGAIVGQEIGKSIADYLDVAGVFGTSQNEKNLFVQGGAALTGSEYTGLQGIPRDRIEQLRAVLQSNATDISGTIGGVFADRLVNQNGRTQSQAGAEYLRPQLQFLGIDTNALAKIAKENPGATVDELIAFLQELNIAGSKARQGIDQARKLNPVTEYPDEINRLNRRDGGITPTDRSNLITESVDNAIDRIKRQADTAGDRIKAQYEVPYNLGSLGPGGLQEQQLQSQLLAGQITGQQYNVGIESLRGLPDILGQAIPLFQQMGLSTEGLVQKLYEAGPAGQQSFQQIIAPLVQAYQTTQEYAALQQALIQLEAQKPNTVNDAEAKKLQEEIDLLQQKIALKQADAASAQGYLDTVGPGAGNLLQNFFQAQQKATVIKGSRGTPAQFQAPSLFDASDYSIEQISKALDQTRDKQAQLVKLFPEYAREFAKQQFVLDNGAGGFKPVGGINQQFFSGFLQQQKQLQKPDLIDLSQYSDSKIGEIIQRAASLQASAIKLAPDLAEDADKSRLLILRKNNDLLQQNGLSQDFLRIAIDELTKSNEDILRGHFNLPADYRAPTVFDYYDSGGREKGSINYPSPGGDANLDLAQKIADAIISSQGKIAGQAADLSALGNTIEPGSRPIGYPNPGSPGTPDRVIPPPPLPDLSNILRQQADTSYDAVEATRSSPGFSAQVGKSAEQSANKLKLFEAAADRNQKKLDLLEGRFDNLSQSAQKSSDAFSTVTSLYTGAKTTLGKFSDGFNTFIDQFAPKSLSPLIRTAFLQGLGQIAPGAIALNIVINGQSVPTQQAKVTIGTTGTGGQTLGVTSTTQRGRPN